MTSSKTLYFTLREIPIKSLKDSSLVRALESYHQIFMKKAHAMITGAAAAVYTSSRIQSTGSDDYWHHAVSTHAKNAVKRAGAKTVEMFDSIFKDCFTVSLNEAYMVPVTPEEASSVLKEGKYFTYPAKINANLPLFEYDEEFRQWKISKFFRLEVYCDWEKYEARTLPRQMGFVHQIKIKKQKDKITIYAGTGTSLHHEFRKERIKGFDYKEFNRLSNPANLI